MAAVYANLFLKGLPPLAAVPAPLPARVKTLLDAA